jgi:hypothetical protein
MGKASANPSEGGASEVSANKKTYLVTNFQKHSPTGEMEER